MVYYLKILNYTLDCTYGIEIAQHLICGEAKTKYYLMVWLLANS